MNETSPSGGGITIRDKKRKPENSLGAGSPGPILLQRKNARVVASFEPPADAFAPTPNVEGCGGRGLAGGGAAGGAFTIPGGGDPAMAWDDASTIILSVPAAASTRISAAVLAGLLFIFGLAVKPKSLVATAAVAGGPPAAHGAAPATAQATPEELGPSSGATSAAR